MSMIFCSDVDLDRLIGVARDVADFLDELRGKGLVRRELSLTGPRRYTHHLFQPGWLGKAKLLAGRAPG